MTKSDPSQFERLTVTVEEAAKMLGIGRTLAYDLARKGELPGVIRIGSRYVVSRPKIDQWLMSKSNPTTT